MPAHITHALAGLRCLRDAPGSEGPSRSAAFLLGCQGPDIFSHNRLTKPLALAYSRLLHRRGYGTFCASFAERVISGRDGQSAHGQSAHDSSSSDWLFGFVTHQAVDRALHPYIVYRSYYTGGTGLDGVSPARMHAFLERILDTGLYRMLEKKPVSAFDSAVMLLDGDLSPLVEDIAFSLARTYPGETDDPEDLRSRVTNALTDSRLYYDATNPARVSMDEAPDPARAGTFLRFGIDGVALLHPEKLAPGVDWLNECRSLWLDPITGAERHESVSELFHGAVECAGAAMGALRAALDGTLKIDELARVIGNGPLSVTGCDGHIAPVRFSDPFDLALTLRAEADKRLAWLSSYADVDP